MGTQTVRLLLGAAGIEMNMTDGKLEGQTALIVASKNGHMEVVRLLLGAAGIEVNIADKEGRTAHMEASANGYTEVAQLLLESGKSAAPAMIQIPHGLSDVNSKGAADHLCAFVEKHNLNVDTSADARKTGMK